MIEEVTKLFHGRLQSQLINQLNKRWCYLQEIRIRMQQPIELIFDHQTEWINGVYPDKEDVTYLINQLTQFSLYRMEEELKKGYVTIKGGHRVGLAGKVNTENGSVKAIKDITFFNIRIAKQKLGVADSCIEYLFDNGYLNTLLIGAPQSGKTTLLRDIARAIGTGWSEVKAQKVGIVDERSEIAGSTDGIPQHQVGLRTDVLDACPKAEGIMMLIRSMSPDVIIVDEIGNEQDVAAIQEALHAGVKVICSAHGNSLYDVKHRVSFQPLFQSSIFQRFIILKPLDKTSYISTILNENGSDVRERKKVQKHEVARSITINHNNNLDWIGNRIST